MGRGKKKDTLEEFNIAARHAGHTYAEEQRRETIRSMGKVRAPRDENGELVYMKVSARSTLKNTGRAAGEKNNLSIYPDISADTIGHAYQ